MSRIASAGLQQADSDTEPAYFGRRLVMRGHLPRGTIIRDSQLNFTLDSAVATIALNRPADGNLINERMAAELRELAREISFTDSVRVVILTGAGPVFSTGREFAGDVRKLDALRVSQAVAGMGVPVLAALNGDASDHGLELALAADLRVASPEGRFWFSIPATGHLPFDGGSQRLPRLIGASWARDMLLTGRKITASEAFRIGLINRVTEPGEDVLESARELADQIAQGSPLGARFVKEAVNSGADMPLVQALGLEADLNVILQSTSDRAEGIASFLERRPPKFSGQ